MFLEKGHPFFRFLYLDIFTSFIRWYFGVVESIVSIYDADGEVCTVFIRKTVLFLWFYRCYSPDSESEERDEQSV